MMTMKTGQNSNGSPSPGRGWHLAGRWLILLSVIALALICFPPKWTGSGIEFEEGHVAREDVYAPFDFYVMKDDAALLEEQERAAAEVPSVLDYDLAESRNTRFAIDTMVEDIRAIFVTTHSPDSVMAMVRDLALSLDDQSLAVLADSVRGPLVVEKARDFVMPFMENGILASRDSLAQVRGIEGRGRGLVTVRRGYVEEAVPVNALVDREEVARQAIRVARETFGDDQAMVRAFSDIVWKLTVPNLSLNKEETERRTTRAREMVPPYTDIVLEGEKIIGSQETVTRRHLEILRSLRGHRPPGGLSAGPWRAVLPYGGRLLTAALVLSLLGIFLYERRESLFRDMRQLLLVSLIMGVVMVQASLVSASPRIPDHFILLPLVAMLVTIVFDETLAFLVALALGILIGLLAQISLSALAVILVGCIVSIVASRRLRRRTAFFRAMAFVGGAQAVAAAAIHLGRLTSFSFIAQESLWGFSNGIVSGAVAMVTLPVLEWAFGITTDIRLIELSDLDHPILRKLAHAAPGTFLHSRFVGDLAEAAGEAVGANPLLARVGGYYHDIGKIGKAEYFVENQMEGQNKHDRLSASMSALILTSHIREGVEMARMEHLPSPIIDIIQQHHGTSLMVFFYRKALNSNPRSLVREEDYRYPGPRPRSREAAIVLLADSVEAAARAMAEPTPSRVKGRVREIIDGKFRESELDECMLTLRELRKIEAAFVRVLTAMYHHRVDYPLEPCLEAVGGQRGKGPSKQPVSR